MYPSFLPSYLCSAVIGSRPLDSVLPRNNGSKCSRWQLCCGIQTRGDFDLRADYRGYTLRTEKRKYIVWDVHESWCSHTDSIATKLSSSSQKHIVATITPPRITSTALSKRPCCDTGCPQACVNVSPLKSPVISCCCDYMIPRRC